LTSENGVITESGIVPSFAVLRNRDSLPVLQQEENKRFDFTFYFFQKIKKI